MPHGSPDACEESENKEFSCPKLFYLGGAQFSPFLLIYFKQMEEKSQKRGELGEGVLRALTDVLYILSSFFINSWSPVKLI